MLFQKEQPFLQRLLPPFGARSIVHCVPLSACWLWRISLPDEAGSNAIATAALTSLAEGQ
jgi:hypothetical protein